MATPVNLLGFYVLRLEKIIIHQRRNETKVTIVPKMSIVFLHYGIVCKIIYIWGQGGNVKKELGHLKK